MSPIESYVFSIIMYTITILALIGAIHLIYNICFCHKKCKNCTCFRFYLKRKLKTKEASSTAHHTTTRERERPQKKKSDYDDYDMESETFTSKICKIVVVSTVLFFLIFLFVGCYQITQSMHINMNITIATIFSYHSVAQCRILFCMIAFYVYGKMLLYAYFVLRAYNMLEGSHLNYNKTTVIAILSIYFIMMNFILFSMIYVHLTDDYCNQSIAKTTNDVALYQQKRSIVFGVGAAVDGSMAILSVSLLIYKLFALVRQSMNVHGGLNKITPLPSPNHTPRSRLSQSLTHNIPSNHKTLKPSQLSINLHRIRSLSSISRASSSNNTPNRDIKSLKAYQFNTTMHHETDKTRNKKYEIRLSKQIQTQSQSQSAAKSNRKNKAIRKKQIDNVIMNSIRRCSRSTNDSADDSSKSNHSVTSNPTLSVITQTQTQTTTNPSAPSSTRQSHSHPSLQTLQVRRVSRSITPDICPNIDMDDVPELELESILSNEQLVDSDIDKVKKLSIGQLLQKDELRELAQHCAAANTNMEDIDENEGFDMIEEDETDKMITPEMLLTFDDLALTSYDAAEDEVDEEDEDEEAKEWRPLTANTANSNTNRLRDFPGTLQIPSNSTLASVSPRTQSPNASPRAMSQSKSNEKSKSKSPRNLMLSLSRRSSSLLQLVNLNRTAEIVSNISTEHIRRFHNVTRYDNEILLLSTKLLILLTVCVLSSFCSFILLFGVLRTKENSTIFFVYGIDSFINVWCLAFTFKFSNRCYNALFNCGTSYRLTKLCFPVVKTAALTWKFCCCYKQSASAKAIMRHAPKEEDKHKKKAHKKMKNGREMNGMHPVSQTSMTYSYQLSSNSVYRKSMHSIEERDKREEHIGSGDPFEDEDEFDELEVLGGFNEDDEEEDVQSMCHVNCCFCCCGNEQEIQIYHMARGEVELMLRQNRKLYR